MVVQFMYWSDGKIYYKVLEVLTINIGWDFYILFDHMDKAQYYRVVRITCYTHDSLLDTIMKKLSEDKKIDLIANVSLLN